MTKIVILQKPVIEVKPVAWVGETPMKYQAQVTLIRANKEKKILVGDPISTEAGAMTSLIHEVMQRQDDIQCIITVLKETGAI